MKNTKAKKINKIKQPDYLLFIICVSLVLFIFGLIGWLIIGAKQVEHSFREHVVMQVYLIESANYTEERDGLIEQLSRLRAVKSVVYKDKEQALAEWRKFGGEDFMSITKENILPESLEISFNSHYVNPEEVREIKRILDRNTLVSDVQYPFDIFSQFRLVRQITFYLSLLGAFMLIVAIVILSYLVKLIVYNNRFIIRSMTLVGASNRFISAPFERRSVWNGFVSALLAVIVFLITVRMAVKKIPDLANINTSASLVAICVVMLLLGIFISWISTFFTVRKYLNASALEKFY